MQKAFPVLTNEMNSRCFTLDAKTTSLLTQFVTRKISFTSLPQDLKNMIMNQRNLMRKADPEVMMRVKKEMKRHVLLMTRAFEFKRKAESVLQGNNSWILNNRTVLQEFKTVMKDANSLLTNVSNEAEKKKLVDKTEEQIRVIFKEYPELYRECTDISIPEKPEERIKEEQRGRKEEKRSRRGKEKKHRVFRPYEEKAFDMEEERFEYDRIVNLMKSTVEILEKILEGSKEHELKAIHLKCIREMYGGYGNDFVEQLHEKPDNAILVFYDRLYQKLDEAKDAKTAIDDDFKKALRKLGS